MLKANVAKGVACLYRLWHFLQYTVVHQATKGELSKKSHDLKNVKFLMAIVNFLLGGTPFSCNTSDV